MIVTGTKIPAEIRERLDEFDEIMDVAVKKAIAEKQRHSAEKDTASHTTAAEVED